MTRRDGAQKGTEISTPRSPSPLWLPDFAQINEQPQEEVVFEGRAPMSQWQANTPGKTSSDSGQSTALDRWSQRRLQRLNTEQGFREQRQGGGQAGGIYSPNSQTSFGEQASYNPANLPYASQEPQAQIHNQQAQPHPSSQPAYHSERTVQVASHPNAGLTSQAQPVSFSSRPTYNQRHESSPSYGQPISQHSPPDSLSSQSTSQETARPSLAQARSYNQQQQAGAEDSSMSSSNNGSLSAPKVVRQGAANRQSMHNGIASREGSNVNVGQQTGGQGVPAFNASVVPAGSQSQNYQAPQKPGEMGRSTPQPIQAGEEMSEEDVNQLLKEHKELRTLPRGVGVTAIVC